MNLLIVIAAMFTGIISCNPGPGMQDSDTGSHGASTASGDSLLDKKSSNGDLDKSKDESQQGNNQ